MALLRDEESGEVMTLAARTLIGRSSVCGLRIADRRVSGEHASLLFRDGSWHMRDLSSRNGSFVNDERVEAGATVELREGDLLSFGRRARRFCFQDASEPGPLAQRPSTGELRHPTEGMLVLPSEEQPVACVFEIEEGRWSLEIEGEARSVADGDVVEVEGEAWILRLPIQEAHTAEAFGSDRRPLPSLRLRVSRDEESVELLMLTEGGGSCALPPRAHYYTLLTLARIRQEAEEKGDLPSESCGWVGVDDLCRMLAFDEMKLNVEVYRIRRDLKRAKIAEAASLIERRRSSRQIRLAWTGFVIETMG